MSELQDVLQYLGDSGIIDLTYVKEQIDMNKRKIALNQHPYKIYQGSDGYWRTYIPCEGKTNNRKLIKKKTQREVEDIVIDYWKQYNKTEELESVIDCTFKTKYFEWITRQKNCGRSDNTIYKYECDFKKYFEDDEISIMNIKDINDEIISLFFKRLVETNISWKSLNAIFGYLKGIFKKCIRDRLVTENPCDFVDIEMFKEYCKEPNYSSEKRVFNDSEIDEFIKKIVNNHNMAGYGCWFAIYTGMRVGEIAALKWSDIDYEHKTILVDKSEKYNRKTKEYYMSLTKTKKSRIIPLTDNAINVLNEIKKYCEENNCFDDYIMSDENGKVHASRISDFARNNSNKSVHALRRTLNSKMRCNGVSETIASSILGHSEKVNNMNYTYDVFNMDDKRRIMEVAYGNG